MKKLSLIIIVILITSASAQIPTTVNYQGVLKDGSGVLVPDGEYQLTFNLYSSESGGTSLWTEVKTIPVSGGIINTLLGSVTPLSLPFDTLCWLGISVEGGSELTPRIALSSVPYSFMTMNVRDNSITADKLTENSVNSSKIIDGSINETDIGGGQVVKSINNLKDSVKISAGTNVTITPSGNTLTISASGNAGTITGVTAGDGLSGGGTTGNVSLSVPTGGITSAMVLDNSVTAADLASGQVVKSLNTLKDDVTLLAGSNISITPSGQNLTISSTASGMGGSGTTNFIPIFTGSATLGNSTISFSAPNTVVSNNFLIEKNDNYFTFLRIKNTNTGSGSGEGISFENEDGTISGIRVYDNDNSSYPSEMNIYNNRPGGKINLLTGSQARITIANSGNIGIGTESPEYPLHIYTNNFRGGNFISGCASNLADVVHSEYIGSGNYDAKAYYGSCVPEDGYGYGGYLKGGYIGAFGYNPGGSYTGTSYGVYGSSTGTAGARYGVYGSASGSAINYGIYGYAAGGTTNWAGYFHGNVNITQTLTKLAGSFRIDHPLDPANKYLYHSFVESPDMKNIYDGTAVLDYNGEATIQLPDWFEALNKDFRYQLTCIGGYANVYIAEEINNNRFKIAGGVQGLKVSWQVTGIRHDAYAENNRIPVEELKNSEEKGKYIYPEGFGLSKEMSIDAVHKDERMKELEK